MLARFCSALVLVDPLCKPCKQCSSLTHTIKRIVCLIDRNPFNIRYYDAFGKKRLALIFGHSGKNIKYWYIYPDNKNIFIYRSTGIF